VRFRAIATYGGACSVMRRCALLGVTSGGYYAWRDRPESDRCRRDRILAVRIAAIFHEFKQVYGSPRVHRELREEHQVRCSRKRVARLMRQKALRAVQARKFKHTTDSDHARPVAPNRLAAAGPITRPDFAYATDATYIWTQQGWLYLAAVMDLGTRRIVGWAVSHRLTRPLMMAALRQAIQQRRPRAGVLHHSDRGSQYASKDYQAMLEQHGMIPSMSGKGNCYDNATMESFFHSLKVERVHRVRYASREEARRDLFEYIEMFYNRKRRHSALGYISPVAFEQRLALC
jgi:putative transposase